MVTDKRRRIQPKRCSGLKLAGAAPQPPLRCQFGVNWLGVCPDSGSLRQQPSLGDTPLLLAQESRASCWGRDRDEPLITPTNQRRRYVFLLRSVPSCCPIGNEDFLNPPVSAITSLHSRDHFQPFSREMFDGWVGILLPY